ncbi:MAG: alpha/beta hydrolase [Byssovorax sp.]
MLTLWLAGCAPAGPAAPPKAPAPLRPTTFVLVHGAWGGGWDWQSVDRRLRALGHDVRRPTLTGLGERVHLARPEIDLSVHIEDIVNVVRFDDLSDVVLVGHSYGGMVITGVAERLPDRVRRLIYVDAFLPEDGESAASLLRSGGGGGFYDKMTRGDLLVPIWVKDGGSIPGDVPQPRRTFEEPIHLASAAARALPASYILTVDPGAAPEKDTFFRYAERARARGYPVAQLAADHTPERSSPEALVALLVREATR